MGEEGRGSKGEEKEEVDEGLSYYC